MPGSVSSMMVPTFGDERDAVTGFRYLHGAAGQRHVEFKQPGHGRVEVCHREAEVVQPRRVHAREHVVGRRPAAEA